MANHVAEHERLLKKTNQELLIDDNGEGSEQYQEAWAILADKGYQGAATMLRVVHPKKKPRNGELTAEEHARNARVSSDRVLVENLFGRVCLLWEIMHSTFNDSSFDIKRTPSWPRPAASLVKYMDNVYCLLDEADRLLDVPVAEDLSFIFDKLPATMLGQSEDKWGRG
ncbi:hypothetical protein PR001_g3399 [Phytophthora rubi]|uniref:DDE Tnp4 domain-containing protein n=1 Tax=Phytophthora rubi TaxID=129364 RepID=A0A6A3PA70_9STRA|nr:hypothetical protein PR001_g3399 [Phytophthora rubi]